jgi:hypothetical protein
VAFTNYARVQGSSPGVHTLAFRLRLDDGIRVRRVVIEPGSGLSLTRQPPQALAVRSTTVLPASPVVGQPFTVRFSIVNRGVVESGPLTLDPLLPPGIERRGRLPHLASLGPGAARSTDLVYSAARPGAYRIETLASSSVGQALVVARPQVVVAAARRAPAGAEEGGGGGSDGWLLALGVSIVGLAGAGIWRVRRTADARRRHGRGPSART